MIKIDIPDFASLQIHHLVLDYNGTLAIDGKLISGVMERLEYLDNQIEIHIITADTFGTVRTQIERIPGNLVILETAENASSKLDYINKLGANTVVAMGNGRNDRLMLKKAAIGILVLQEEGVSSESLINADVVVSNINSALDLLLNPLRLKATLRS